MARSYGYPHPDPVSFDQSFTLLGPAHVTAARRIVEYLRVHDSMQWRSLKRFASEDLDRVGVERTVEALFEAGWIVKRMREDRIGESRCTRILLCERGEVEAKARWPSEPESSPVDPVSEVAALLERLRDAPGATPPFPERLVVQRALGSTKALRLRDHRPRLEARLGQPLEALVLFHTDSLLTAGPVTYRFRGVPGDLRGSFPWSGLPFPVVDQAEALSVHGADRIICVENQTPFEVLCHQQVPERAVLVFTAGYAGRAQRRWLERLCVEGGLDRVLHWGDLDPHGLMILRDLRRFLARVAPAASLLPWRMDPKYLQLPEAVSLSPQDREQLQRYLEDPDAPARPAAEAMLSQGRKLEQEALLGSPASLRRGEFG